MKKLLACAAAAVAMFAVGTADAKKPANPGNGPGNPGISVQGIDLVPVSMNFKVKSKQGVNQINNFSFYIANVGDTDAPNSRVEFYLSADPVFSPIDDPLNPTDVPDVLIHSQSLGKVKAGKSKKRTVGGGHLKQIQASLGGLPLTGYVIAVIDSTNVVAETIDPLLLLDGEANNTIFYELPN